MTDQKPTPEEPVLVAAAAVGDESGVFAETAVAVQGRSAVLVARFADMDAAADAYEALREAESVRAISIEGVLVVDAAYDGKISIRKLTDHHTRNGTAWGAVAGGALAIIFPPSILAGVIAGGAIGAIAGKVGNVVTKGQVAKELATVITPGSSGIVALVDITAVDAVKETIPEATEVKAVPVDDETAGAIKEAAEAASAGATA